MDWDLCIICQQRSVEKLQCPANSKRKDAGVGYTSFVCNLKEFQKLEITPECLNVERLDEGLGIEQTLLNKKASWHKSCRDLFSNTKLERAKKRKLSAIAEEEDRDDCEQIIDVSSSSPIKARRSSNASSCLPENHCFFCDSADSTTNLHSASTLEVDRKVRECANLLNDGKLISKMSVGDLIAVEAKYHAKCLVSLYNRARQFKASTTDSVPESSPTGLDELAFAELIAYIDEQLEYEDLPVLKLSDIVKFFSSKQQELGIESGNVNATRLKERVLSAFPDLTAHNQGREVLLAFKHEIGGVLEQAKNDSEACHLAKAANIIRRDILQIHNCFDGTFAPECQNDTIPPSLKTLIGMIIKGPTTKIDALPVGSQACLTIAQLIIFNSIMRSRNESTDKSRHVRSRETPLPIYTALKIHGATRDRSLVDLFYKLGMSISYDRLLSISTEITNSVIKRYEREGVVCPSKLKEGLFTTAAVDNIDHNPSSTSSHDSFHGTAISLVQHPTMEEPGIDRAVDIIDPTKTSVSKKIAQLPSSYSQVPPMYLRPSDFYAPESKEQLTVDPQVMLNSSEPCPEQDWLDNTLQLLSKENLEKDDFLSWAAYRASKSMLSSHEPAIISLLPMFIENAHSVAMIAHSLKVIKAAVNQVNPTQIPVVAVDQPLFALAKQIQWTFNEIFNEDQFVIMLGGLHIEMAAFKMLGKWLSGSGWAEALCNAGVATQGVANSFLAASHLTRTRRAHQVTAVSLHMLMVKGYDEYTLNVEENDQLKSFHEWREEMSEKCPQFLYWSGVLELQLCVFQLVKV